MTEIEAIHTAARRYCIDEHARWFAAYNALTARDQTVGPKGYTDEHYHVFPRFQVLSAICDDVERFLPGNFASFDEARDLLVVAGETARDMFRTQPSNPKIDATVAEQRASFVAYIRGLGVEDLRRIEPLPYRRVLPDAEAKQCVAEIRARWGWWYGGCTDRREPLPPYMLLQDSRIGARRRDIGVVLASRGVRRIYELPEIGASAEIDLELAQFDLSEGHWLTPGAEWMVTVSHEDSITIGGEWLVADLQRCWPDWRELVFRGWDGQGEPQTGQ